jgi:hypothetical protein
MRTCLHPQSWKHVWLVISLIGIMGILLRFMCVTYWVQAFSSYGAETKAPTLRVLWRFRDSLAV